MKKKKKNFVIEQNNGWSAQHQAHGKPNRAQRIIEKQTHGLKKIIKKKKNQNPNTEQITKSKTSNQLISTLEITKAKANLKNKATEQVSNASP